MKLSCSATIPFVLTLFTVHCLPQSHESHHHRLSTRSVTRREVICMLNRLGDTMHKTYSARDTEEDERQDCIKSIDPVETVDSKESSNLDHIPMSKLSSKSFDSSSHWSSKYEHPKKHAGKKYNQLHPTSRPAESYASMRNTPSTGDSTGGLANNNANVLNQTPVNDPASEANEPASIVNNLQYAVHNPWSPLNHAWDAFRGSYHDISDSDYRGKATFFYQGGNPGACGKVHDDSDFVVAIQSAMYGGGKFCGKTVLVTRKSTGKSIKCIAADECPGCPTHQSLDLSVGAFNALGSPDEGVFDIGWAVID